MKRRFLILSVLTAMLLGAVLTGNRAECRSCPYYDLCVSNYYACRDSCNGNQSCINSCVQDYIQCQCTNCNLCPRDPYDP